ncbi:hypothetical protein OHA27_25520 [Streptomyces sp. NBC_01619]|uniref:hypothetical protein n=1 Tax=Streptomyces sp. NBC_01619 TaxID=2975901 RepID=UPI0022515560|nr:hypothetical protein [Streptomyces sp. NBC_01619]MCX4513622.1 hypothetical protein [Streptomyces sp. NBC_01619]
MERTGTTRRRALIGAGAAVTAALSGCSSDEPGARRDAPPSVSAETLLRRRSAALSSALLGRYDAVLAAHPGLAPRLAPLRAQVALHVEALSPTGDRPRPASSPSPSSSAGAAASPSPSSSSSPSAAVPADAGAAVRELASAERSTAAAHTAALTGAPPEYARLLASVAAAGAVHVYLLTKGSR